MKITGPLIAILLLTGSPTLAGGGFDEIDGEPRNSRSRYENCIHHLSGLVAASSDFENQRRDAIKTFDQIGGNIDGMSDLIEGLSASDTKIETETIRSVRIMAKICELMRQNGTGLERILD
tara:strand:- start:890 stop:1252 length:363 start_codon:yes stop_codon:yes gene_type:complete